METHDIGLAEELFERRDAPAGHRRLAASRKKGAVLAHERLERLVRVDVEVQEVHLVSRDEHAGVGGADAPGADHTERLAP